MAEKITIEIEFIRNPTVTMKDRAWLALIVERLHDRLVGEVGQQTTLSVEAATINGVRKEF